MISLSICQRILRNYTACRIPGLFARGKSTEVSLSNEQLPDGRSQIDWPTINENPYKKEVKKCILCELQINPDYKNVRLLSQFQSRHTGRIYGRHITGLCKHKQERVEQEILKAQNAGLMGYMTKEPKFANDPKLFDPNFPFRPHKY